MERLDYAFRHFKTLSDAEMFLKSGAPVDNAFLQRLRDSVSLHDDEDENGIIKSHSRQSSKQLSHSRHSSRNTQYVYVSFQIGDFKHSRL